MNVFLETGCTESKPKLLIQNEKYVKTIQLKAQKINNIFTMEKDQQL